MRKIRTQKADILTSEDHWIQVEFNSSTFDDDRPIDTDVTLTIPTFAVHWDNREAVLAEIAEVIRKYSL